MIIEKLSQHKTKHKMIDAGSKAATVILLSLVVVLMGTIVLAQTPTGEGLLIYGQTGNFAAKWRVYDSGDSKFTPPSLTKSGSAVPVNFVVRTSPKKGEAVAGYVNANGVLQIACYDGAIWSNDWTAAAGGRGSTRKFDIAYETGSGNAMVLYAADNAADGVLFRTKPSGSGCGESNWSRPVSVHPKGATGVEWIKIASDPRAGSNLLTVVWADNESHFSAMVWSGSAWGNEPAAPLEKSLQVIKSGQDVDDFAVAYESLSGNVKVIWGSASGKNGKSGVREANCVGGTAQCSWSVVTTPPVWSDDATNLELAPNPQSNEMVFASIGKDGSDLQVGYWSGTEWTNMANFDVTASTPKLGTDIVSAGWIGSGSESRSVIVYGNGGNSGFSWIVGNKGKFETQKDPIPASGIKAPAKQLMAMSNPQKLGQLLLLLTDSDDYLFAKQLTKTDSKFSWANIDDASIPSLAKNIPFPVSNSFAFAFWPSAQKSVSPQVAGPSGGSQSLAAAFIITIIIILVAGGFWLVMKKRR